MTEEPRWLAGLSRITPIGAAGDRVTPRVTNPKMLAASAAAGLLIGTAERRRGGRRAVRSRITPRWPVRRSPSRCCVYAAVGARADEQLTRLKEWLHRRSGLVSAVILVAVGIALLLTGISGLR